MEFTGIYGSCGGLIWGVLEFILAFNLLVHRIMRIILLSIFLLSYLTYPAQDSRPGWVEKIDRITDTAQKLNFVLSDKEWVSTDSAFWDFPFDVRRKLGEWQVEELILDTLDSGVELIGLKLNIKNKGPGVFYPGRIYSFYFNGESLIKAVEFYTNNSRMGSCGTLSIQNMLYFRKHEVGFTETIESPFECYLDPIDTSFISTIGHYLEEVRPWVPFRIFLRQMELYKAQGGYEEVRVEWNSRDSLTQNFELHWISGIYQHEHPYRPSSNLEFPSFPVSVTSIGERYLILRENINTPPMGIQPYNLFYFKRKD